MFSLDGCVVLVSYIAAYWFRFEGIESEHQSIITGTYLPVLIIKMICFVAFGMYRGMWRYTSLNDLYTLVMANITASTLNLTWFFLVERAARIFRSVILLDGLLTLLGTAAARVAVRIFFQKMALREKDRDGVVISRAPKNLLIIGAGNSGEKILREMNDNRKLNYRVLGFLDDDRKKHHRRIHGVPILGSLKDLERIIHTKSVEEILIAISSANSQEMRRIVEACEQSQIHYRTVPGIGELIDGSVNISNIRNVDYEDLLGRDPVRLDMGKIGEFINGRSVMVTGAGGSIGSDLCRQIARFRPSLLVMVDRTENNLYHIETEMRFRFKGLAIRAVLSDIQWKHKVRHIFDQCPCQVVFHAAAFKHVPMMEQFPWEAVSNNIRGTANLLAAAAATGVQRFVLVSTDKAVRPTNVMGATKRIAELLTLQATTESLRAMVVRFGNVVGSEGSVVPLFKKQIERGGPVTVTHPEVTRYFMTIPEATQLILQAGAMGTGGELYLLQMGKPIRIQDLAKDLIRLSGFEPEVDIRIEYIGLRPGEKLYEELITKGEGIVSTEHEKIMILRGGKTDGDQLERGWRAICRAAWRHDEEGIKARLTELVPEYTPHTNSEKS